DLESTLGTCARRVAQIFRTPDCVVVGHVGDKQVTVSSRGTPDAALLAQCRAALEAEAPTFTSSAGGPVALGGAHLSPPGGPAAGRDAARFHGPRERGPPRAAARPARRAAGARATAPRRARLALGARAHRRRSRPPARELDVRSDDAGGLDAGGARPGARRRG